MDFLQTGDIILFQGRSFLSYLLEYFGRSPYSHVGMIVRNPSFLNPALEDGIYLLESGWNPIPDVETGQTKIGVQLHFLEDILKECQPNTVYVRKVECQRDQPTRRDQHDGRDRRRKHVRSVQSTHLILRGDLRG